jgi:hypothetical protein
VRGKKWGCIPFWVPPYIPVCAEVGWHEPREGEGTEHPCSAHVAHGGHQLGCGQVGATQQEGREHANTVCMLPPLFTPPTCCIACKEGGRQLVEGGRGAGVGRGCCLPPLPIVYVLFSVVFLLSYSIHIQKTKTIQKVEFKIEWRKNGRGGPDREISAKSQRLIMQ